MPHRIARAGRQTPAMGFAIDVVGYGQRIPWQRELVQQRFFPLIVGALADLGLALKDLPHCESGDCVSAFLPAGTDPSHALPYLLAAITTRLSDDNERHADRIRARMAVGFGLFGIGPMGFTGQLIVDVSRLTESAALRAALAEHPESDLVVLVSQSLYDLTVESGHLSPAPALLRQVNVSVKEFSANAWLWVSPTSGRLAHETHRRTTIID